MPIGRSSMPAILRARLDRALPCAALVGPSASAARTTSVTPVLEVWDARDPFDAVAEYLEDAGFYGGTQPADVYFGYGISDGLRRLSLPAPAEPCALAARRLPHRPRAEHAAGDRDRLLGAHLAPGRLRPGDPRRALGDRARRRLPGEPRPAPVGAVPRQRRGTGATPRAARPAPPRAARGRRLGDRLRLAGALPPAPRPHAHHAPDQGDATARRRRRAARLREGRGRAHDDRRPRAKRPRARVRARARFAGPSSWPRSRSPASRTSSRPSRARSARA